MDSKIEIDGKQRKFVWGPVKEVYRIGPYEVVRYHPQIFKDSSGTGNYDYTVNQYHPYVKGEDTNESYDSLDAALVGAIAYRREGGNHRADRYFILALERLEQV